MQYRGSLMPLVYPNYDVRRREEGTQPMLVFSDAGRSMGLVVDEIVEPAATRSALATALVQEVHDHGVRRGAHGNIPL